MTELTIERSRWYRGKGPGGSRLLLPSGQMCCVGCLLDTVGIDRERMLGVACPADIITNERSQAEDHGIPDFLLAARKVFKTSIGVLDNSKLCSQLMAINDSTEMSDTDRERNITRLLGAVGIRVRFV
jgi:hypothetical protein